LGHQLDYETPPISYSSVKKRFDLYLQEAIRACLVDWRKDEEKEECQDSQETELESEPSEEETETIAIERPDGMLW
jgi:hypothetical protein